MKQCSNFSDYDIGKPERSCRNGFGSIEVPYHPGTVRPLTNLLEVVKVILVVMGYADKYGIGNTVEILPDDVPEVSGCYCNDSCNDE